MAAELNSSVKVGKAFGGGIAIATSAEWDATTKVFPAGLWLQESDTGLLKITDGENTYSNLPYRVDPFYTGLPVFYHFYHDTFINNPSFVHADNFSWHSGAIFVKAYGILVEEYNSEDSVDVTEVIEGFTITYKETPSGYKIVDAANANAVASIFDATGVAWYYILDQTNQFFKLPRNSQLTMGRDALTSPGTYTELSAASGAGFSVGTIRQYLYFFMGNSIQNEGNVDFAGVNSSLTNLATRVSTLESSGTDIDLSGYATTTSLNAVNTTATNAATAAANADTKAANAATAATEAYNLASGADTKAANAATAAAEANTKATNAATAAANADTKAASKMDKAGGTFTGGIFEKVVAMSNASINTSAGTYFSKTITANTTFTITGTPSSAAATISLILTNGGNYTVTWPSSFKWAEGTPPTLTSGGTDLLTFATIDGGTTWYCAHSLANVS